MPSIRCTTFWKFLPPVILVVKLESIHASACSYSPSRQTYVYSILCLHIRVRHETGYLLKFLGYLLREQINIPYDVYMVRISAAL